MRERITIYALCLAIAAVAVGAAGWAVFTGQMELQGIDALFLLAVCLAAAVFFAAIPLVALRDGSLRELLKRKAARPEKKGPQSAAAVSRTPQEHS